MSKKYYITTTLPYVNSDPHIGFALEIVQADAIARWHRLMGEEVVFNTGTDEHGQKIWKNAQEAGMEPQAYTDMYAAKFDGLKKALNLSYTNFIRTTDPDHVAAAQEFWKRCNDNGDIYKKHYQVKYCVGCELEKTDSELEDGKCPIHPTLEIELRDEENYFFRWSAYQEKLLALYKEREDFVVPANRLNEIRKFVEGGLNDFSISRLKEKMPWGVPVPGDEDHVMYVWFDALVNYISTLGWPDGDGFKDFWPGEQVAGKDNLRQQSAMWQAMLMSAGVEPSTRVFIHGFITSGGQKMSKSSGNVVDPYAIIEKYGTDAVRYFLLGGLSSYEDGDYTQELFEEGYTAKLVNGVGNLTARVTSMVEKYVDGKAPSAQDDPFDTGTFWKKYDAALHAFRFDETVRTVEELISACDKLIEDKKPWKMAKEGEDVGPLMYQLSEALRHIGIALLPIIPETAENILKQVGQKTDAVDRKWGGLEEGTPVNKGEILFARL